MNAPMIWIVIPAFLAVTLYLIRRWERITLLVGSLGALTLAALAWRLPIGVLLFTNIFPMRVSDTMFVLGRRFVIENSDRPMLAIIYLAAGLWFFGAYTAKAGRLFIPLGMGVVTLMIAALAVEPFLYAALLIQMAVFLCVPILLQPGRTPGRGVVRFLTFQTFGIPFILFAGWLLAGADAGSLNLPQITRAAVFLAIGFCFLLAIIPFHTWITLLAQESHPYASAFVFFMLPGIASLFGLSFIERYAWLRNSPNLYLLLQTTGVVMVVAGGVWAAFQRHLGRMLGWAVIVEIGLSLLALSTNQGAITRPLLGAETTTSQITIFFTLFLSRGMGLGAWAVALSIIRMHAPDLRFSSVQGFGRRLPFASACLILAHLSLAGFPLLVGFPSRLALWELLARTVPQVSFFVMLGSLGLLVGGIRSLAVLVMGQSDEPQTYLESRQEILFLSTAIIILISAGIYPFAIH
jgi:NADH-quinone oxidoreductase subunit N